jgi:hypothetical protein
VAENNESINTYSRIFRYRIFFVFIVREYLSGYSRTNSWRVSGKTKLTGWLS